MAIDSHMHLNSTVSNDLKKQIIDINDNSTIEAVSMLDGIMKLQKNPYPYRINIQNSILLLEFIPYI